MRAVLKSSKARSFCMISVASLVSIVLALLLARDLLFDREGKRDSNTKWTVLSKGNTTVITSRKLLLSDDGETKRVGTADCSNDDIVIYQGEVPPLPNGIPSYAVQIMNMCPSDDCEIADIRVHCGWFSSARLINPSVFRRLDYDDCLVNDGQPLGPGRTISFEYANTFRYDLSVSSVVCLS
ncbi:TPD1 protein homolog 1-like [Lotus japonicus]|uniref:TPD1 protein homolog 1-like n=1 Tax=Lotus japonicus TaxID=34305 RepID=UPI00259092C0|nr:TPD1 protein homolog 1-like [Lotus japonicus]